MLDIQLKMKWKQNISTLQLRNITYAKKLDDKAAWLEF